ncbi:hypothetical protein J6590_049448 [Homalodisca vitripennis]|nr:hypothetical protein J6590_049448 [Homalodisca vitripennis]
MEAEECVPAKPNKGKFAHEFVKEGMRRNLPVPKESDIGLCQKEGRVEQLNQVTRRLIGVDHLEKMRKRCKDLSDSDKPPLCKGEGDLSQQDRISPSSRKGNKVIIRVLRSQVINLYKMELLKIYEH